VLIINDFDEAVSELGEMLGGRFGTAGNRVVIEEYLNGIEMSAFIITDGISYRILPEAKDYKRIGEATRKKYRRDGSSVTCSVCNTGFLEKVERRES
jgi:phosphoribosylamine--glycine ligase